MAPVMLSHTMMLFHMTPTPDVVYRRLPAQSTLTTIGNYYKSPLDQPRDAILIWFFPSQIFLTEVFSVDMLATCPK